MTKNAIDINRLYIDFKGHPPLIGTDLLVNQGEFRGPAPRSGTAPGVPIKSLLDFCHADQARLQIFDVSRPSGDGALNATSGAHPLESAA